MGHFKEIKIGFIDIACFRIGSRKGRKGVEQMFFRILTKNGQKSKDIDNKFKPIYKYIYIRIYINIKMYICIYIYISI